MSSTSWFLGYEDEAGLEAEVSLCDYGPSIHLHMEHIKHPENPDIGKEGNPWRTVPPVSVTLTVHQARALALELLRRAFVLLDDDVEYLDAQIGFVTGKPVEVVTSKMELPGV